MLAQPVADALRRLRHGLRKHPLRVLSVAIMVLGIGTWTYHFEFFWIPTDSMWETLSPGDVILTQRFASREAIQHNDVVVFYPTFAPRTAFIKRVVGLPGDTLAMRAGVLYRNGSPLQESFVRRDAESKDVTFVTMRWQEEHLLLSAAGTKREPTRDEWGPLAIPGDRYFVLGDHRTASADSRYWGLLRSDQIRYELVRVLTSTPLGKHTASASP